MANHYDESRKMSSRARRLIPGGAHTYSKGDDQFPEVAPRFITRGCGCHVWDVDGNEFIDWGMGLRTVILGHAYEPVLEAVRDALTRGVNFTRPSPIELELADQIVDQFPCAEMVKFAKNGSDVTTAAVKLARAFTGRDIVIRCADHPFFSVHDWFIGDTVCDAGVPEATKALTKRFVYNDLESLRSVLEANAGKVACVITEAAATAEPAPGFLRGIKDLCAKHGAIFILDEMITGLRWHARGAQALYGVTPDIATFGKAVANGFSCSFLAGKREILELGGIDHDKPRVFLLSATHGAETHSLAACKATLQIAMTTNLTEQVWITGARLIDAFNSLAAEHGIAEFVSMRGPGCSPWHRFVDRNDRPSPALTTLYQQEMIRQGILIPYIAPSLSHSPSDIDRTCDAMREALSVVRVAIERDSTEGLLQGGATRPVFRRFN